MDQITLTRINARDIAAWMADFNGIAYCTPGQNRIWIVVTGDNDYTNVRIGETVIRDGQKFSIQAKK